MPERIFLSTKLSVVDLSRFQGELEGIEFMWRGADMWLGRIPSWKRKKAVEIAERIQAEATSEAEALAIFEKMS